MAKGNIGIGFSVPAELHEQFKRAADAEHRTVKGALIVLMEQRVAEHEADRNDVKAEAA
jgi:hypothetical protein